MASKDSDARATINKPGTAEGGVLFMPNWVGLHVNLNSPHFRQNPVFEHHAQLPYARSIAGSNRPRYENYMQIEIGPFPLFA